MNIVRSGFGALAAVALAVAPVVVSASDQAVAWQSSAAAVSSKTVPATQFSALKSVKATPMTSRELDAVKGQHVHFITLSNGKLHLAGDIKTENNWSNEWGGSDGNPVAPSYHGLCVAHGNGQIFIPTSLPGQPPTPVTLQCPAGS